MIKYIGLKIIKAEQMMKDGKEGYKVIYKDGYESWSPKAIFEDAYRPLVEVDFYDKDNNETTNKKEMK